MQIYCTGLARVVPAKFHSTRLKQMEKSDGLRKQEETLEKPKTIQGGDFSVKAYHLISWHVLALGHI